MTTNSGLVAPWDSITGPAVVAVAGTPAIAMINSPSFDGLINDIARRFEIALELGPWLKAGEDTLRRLDRLLE